VHPCIILSNKTNLVHNLFLVYLSISTRFGRLCAHHQEKQLYLCDTWYLLFCMDDCVVCKVEWNCFIPPCIPDSHPHRITSTKCRINTAVSQIWRSWDRASWYISVVKPTRFKIFRVYWISLNETGLFTWNSILFYRVRQKYWRFCKTVLSGTVGVGNLSLSALLARLKALQLPWSTGL